MPWLLTSLRTLRPQIPHLKCSYLQTFIYNMSIDLSRDLMEKPSDFDALFRAALSINRGVGAEQWANSEMYNHRGERNPRDREHDQAPRRMPGFLVGRLWCSAYELTNTKDLRQQVFCVPIIPIHLPMIYSPRQRFITPLPLSFSIRHVLRSSKAWLSTPAGERGFARRANQTGRKKEP
jgi:hypothetical protein